MKLFNVRINMLSPRRRVRVLVPWHRIECAILLYHRWSVDFGQRSCNTRSDQRSTTSYFFSFQLPTYYNVSKTRIARHFIICSLDSTLHRYVSVPQNIESLLTQSAPGGGCYRIVVTKTKAGKVSGVTCMLCSLNVRC